MLNKADLIREEIVDKNVDLFALTETWLRNGDDHALIELCPPGFQFVGHHRPQEKGTRGGGVGFVMRSTFGSQETSAQVPNDGSPNATHSGKMQKLNHRPLPATSVPEEWLHEQAFP